MNYIWHVMFRDQWTPVIVMAWHEGTASVLMLDENDDPAEGTTAFLVRHNELRFGRPPEPVAVAS